MRKILLLRGAPGSGKSTLLDQLGLTSWSLSMDVLRQVLAAPTMLPDGRVSISQAHNDQVYRELKIRVHERMERGEFIALDNTMASQADFDEWAQLADQHGYEVMVADFGGVPLEECLARNSRRSLHQRVPQASVERFHAQASRPLDPRGATVIAWDGRRDLAAAVEQWLHVPMVDLSGYKRVVHIGDLQGCLSVLVGPGGPLEHGFEPDTAYIFVGDLVDRGIENGALVRWFHAHAVGRDNVFLLWGNHEDHLDRFARGRAAASAEFREHTLPQLREAGVSRQMAGEICAMARDVLPYTWRGRRVMACHAGLSSVPERMALVSSHQYARGTGYWEDPVDAQFDRHAPPGWFQVHGHRNHGGVDILASERSVNLEDAVEFGGHLRVATLDESGWSGQAYRNDVFLPARERWAREAARGRKPRGADALAPAWMARESETTMGQASLAAMREHPGVRLRTSNAAPHVQALNFTKDVFFQSSWDEVLVKARGLFIQDQTREIVARGYEKFFNVGERPETRLEALRENLAWPVVAFVKENGYLGNLGFDSTTQELFIASKSTPDGEFAGWFKDIFQAQVPASTRERIRRWLRDHEASMVFEVIDPERDPHMIDYDAPHMVLLDVFHRSERPEKLPYEQMKALAEQFGLTPKRRAMVFPNARALEGWHAQAGNNLAWRFKGEDIEGLVLEDQAGFQTKVKLPHYAFWKRMRSAAQRLGKLVQQREALADDGLGARKQALLARMGELKETVAAHRGQGEAAQAAKEQLRTLGRELGEVSAQLAGKDRRERVEEQIRDTLARDPHPLAQAFLGWAAGQDAQTLLSSSILALRARWKEETAPEPALWQVPWVGFAGDDVPAEEPGTREVQAQARKLRR